jgi:hypothetical protein
MYEVIRLDDIQKVYRLVGRRMVYERGDLDGGPEAFQVVFQEAFLLLFQEQEFPFQKFLPGVLLALEQEVLEELQGQQRSALLFLHEELFLS